MRNSSFFLLLAGAFCTTYAQAEDLQSVMAGAGKVKFGAVLQTWGVNDTTAPAAKFNFRMRRAEIKFSGSVVEDTRWFFMADPAKNLSSVAGRDAKILQDIGVAFEVTPTMEITMGQFKMPTTPEALDSSGELFFPERSMLARTWGDRREPGAMLTYKEGSVKAFMAAMNGQGTNVDDTNGPKDLHLRLETSAISPLQLGAFTTASDFSYARKARWGLNARFSTDLFLARFDVVRAQDTGVRSMGYVGDLGYSFSTPLQAMARYELLDNGVFKGKVATFGLNYYFAKHGSKVQAAYSFLTDVRGTDAAGSYGSYVMNQGAKGSLIILAFQAAI
jgi:hypothetical protein